MRQSRRKPAVTSAWQLALPFALVDTNVPLTANGRAAHAGIACYQTCADTLIELQQNSVILLDSQGLILEEYLKQNPHGSPRGLGDQFLVWVFDNQSNPAHCRCVPITPLPDDSVRQFEEFPDDPNLIAFDQSDKKFVATAQASGVSPPILNATDTDWKQFEMPLAYHGISIKYLCPELMN